MILWGDGKQKMVPLFFLPHHFRKIVKTQWKLKKQQRNSGLNIYSGRNDGRLEGNSDSFIESAFIKIFIKVNSMN
jgi:hypothetical protein